MNGARIVASASGSQTRRMAALFILVLVTIGVGRILIGTSTDHFVAADAHHGVLLWKAEVEKRLVERQTQSPLDPSGLHEIAAGMVAAGSFQSVRIYDSGGLLQTSAGDTGEHDDTISSALATARKASNPYTALSKATEGDAAAVTTVTALPLGVGRLPPQWIVATIDQTQRHARVASAAGQAAMGVALLLIVTIATGVIHNRQQRASAQRALQDASQRDPFTGLANRSTFLAAVTQQVSVPRAERPPKAVILVETSLPDSVHMLFGHDAEEAHIAVTARRLVQEFGGGYGLARVGRFTFGLIVPDASDPIEVIGVAKRLTVHLSQPFTWHQHSYDTRAYAGVALDPADGDTATALYRSAETALDAAGEDGSPGYSFVDRNFVNVIRRLSAVQKAVSRALRQQAFRLEYQPVYAFKTNQISGFEALIRLDDPDLGPIPPSEFIPVAERLGLINSIGAWCLEQACQDASNWPPHLVVAVNLSPFQFESGSLAGDVRSALAKAQMPAYRLEVEITEGTLLNASETVLVQLRHLRDMGVTIALDDFGSGYSSLGYLWKFPFSKLKIDRSLVQAADEGAGAKAIVRAIVRMGQELGLTLTAEGIETVNQFRTMGDLGCQLAQGYLLARPARAEDLPAIILGSFAGNLARRGKRAAEPRSSAA